MSRPKIIRKVTKMGRDGRPKVARDHKAGLTLERVTAHGNRRCHGDPCLFNGGPIVSGNDYVKLIDHSLMRRMGSHQIPHLKDYHWSCVPEIAVPLVDYFMRCEMRSEQSSVTS